MSRTTNQKENTKQPKRMGKRYKQVIHGKGKWDGQLTWREAWTFRVRQLVQWWTEDPVSTNEESGWDLKDPPSPRLGELTEWRLWPWGPKWGEPACLRVKPMEREGKRRSVEKVILNGTSLDWARLTRPLKTFSQCVDQVSLLVQWSQISFLCSQRSPDWHRTL